MAQYEPQYWFFELVIMLWKCIMTGALCIIAPKSAVQPLFAVCFQLGLLCVLLKTAPYKEDIDDYASFISSFSLMFILLMGSALYANQHYPKERALNGETLSAVLMLFTIGSVVTQVTLMFPKCFPDTASRITTWCYRVRTTAPMSRRKDQSSGAQGCRDDIKTSAVVGVREVSLEEKRSSCSPAELKGGKMQVVVEMTGGKNIPLNHRLHFRVQDYHQGVEKFSAAQEMSL